MVSKETDPDSTQHLEFWSSCSGADPLPENPEIRPARLQLHNPLLMIFNYCRDPVVG